MATPENLRQDICVAKATFCRYAGERTARSGQHVPQFRQAHRFYRLAQRHARCGMVAYFHKSPRNPQVLHDILDTNPFDRIRQYEPSCAVNCIAADSATGCHIGVGKGAIRHVAISDFIVETAGTGVHVQSVYGKGPGGVDMSDVSLVNCSFRDCAVAISVSGIGGTPPRSIRLSDILIKETDIVEGPMIRVSEAESPIFRNVRFVRGNGSSREMRESDIAPIPDGNRFK